MCKFEYKGFSSLYDKDLFSSFSKPNVSMVGSVYSIFSLLIYLCIYVQSVSFMMCVFYFAAAAGGGLMTGIYIQRKEFTR